MFETSHKLELNNRYSTGANGIYKHCVYHNIVTFKNCDMNNVCEAITEDFNDMVDTWKTQVKLFHATMKGM